MVNNFIENIFLSWVFGAVICDMYNSIDVHASTVSPFCWKLKIHIFAILWRMKSDLSKAYSRAWVDLESHFCQIPTLSLSQVMGPRCPKKLFRPTGRLLARIYISTIKAGESCLRLILGEHSSLVLYQPGPLLRNCQAVWLPLLHEHQVVFHLFKALLWWKITFK